MFQKKVLTLLVWDCAIYIVLWIRIRGLKRGLDPGAVFRWVESGSKIPLKSAAIVDFVVNPVGSVSGFFFSWVGGGIFFLLRSDPDLLKSQGRARFFSSPDPDQLSSEGRIRIHNSGSVPYRVYEEVGACSDHDLLALSIRRYIYLWIYIFYIYIGREREK